MFWKWKGDVIDANSQVTITFSQSEDKRWSDDVILSPKAQTSIRAPKAVRRQRSSSLDPKDSSYIGGNKKKTSQNSCVVNSGNSAPHSPKRSMSVCRRLSSSNTTTSNKDLNCYLTESIRCRGRSIESRGCSSRQSSSTGSHGSKDELKVKRSHSYVRKKSVSPSRRHQSRSRGGRREERRRSVSTVRRRHSSDELYLEQAAVVGGIQ